MIPRAWEVYPEEMGDFLHFLMIIRLKEGPLNTALPESALVKKIKLKTKNDAFFLIFLLFMPNYEGLKEISFLSIPQVGEKKLSQHLHNRPSHSLTSVMLKQLITFEWMVGSLISFFLNSSEFRQCCNRPIVNAVTCPARA